MGKPEEKVALSVLEPVTATFALRYLVGRTPKLTPITCDGQSCKANLIMGAPGLGSPTGHSSGPSALGLHRPARNSLVVALRSMTKLRARTRRAANKEVVSQCLSNNCELRRGAERLCMEASAPRCSKDLRSISTQQKTVRRVCGHSAAFIPDQSSSDFSYE